MRRTITIILALLMVLTLFVSCDDTMESPVLSVTDLIEAAKYSEKITLEEDLDLAAAGFNNANPLVLDLSGKTLDLNGHTIKGIVCNSIAGNSDKGYQTSDCSLIVVGSGFTIKNGTLTLGASKYPIIMMVNPPAVSENDSSYKASHVYGKNPKNKGISIENITCANGGFIVYDSAVTFADCNLTQAKVKFNYTISTITGLFSEIRVKSGTYNNFQPVTYDYPRWIKLYYSSGWASNGVRHNMESSHYQYVEDSMFYLDKSSLGGEVPERK